MLSVQIAAAFGEAVSDAPEFIREHFPALVAGRVLGIEIWKTLAMLGALALALGLGRLFSRLFVILTRTLSKHPRSSWLVSLCTACQNALTALLALGAFDLAVHWINLTGHVSVVVDRIAHELLILGLAWLLITGSDSLTQSVDRGLSGHDEFHSRGVRTQLLVAHRIFSSLVVVSALALILSGFAAVRSVGVSLLASAGIASVVIGIAAQKSLGGVLAGLQLSITQPVRLGDTVIVDKEYGTVEEIFLTFVVLRLWDERRMVVPASKFLDSSFQNWTRVRTHMLGTVELWVDYTTPMDPLRDELSRICKTSKLWDGKTSLLQVTDTSEKSLRVRALVSAAGPDQLFDLRCEVREKLVAFLKTFEGGRHLPVDRGTTVRFDGVGTA